MFFQRMVVFALVASLITNGVMLAVLLRSDTAGLRNEHPPSAVPNSIDAKFERLRSQYVRFYPVCFDGELQPIKGELTDFARGWFLRHGLPALVDRKGRIWVKPKFHWRHDKTDTILNLSLQAVMAAYKKQHGKRPSVALFDKLGDTCPLYRKWLVKARTNQSPKR